MTFSLPLSNSRGELSKLYCGARPRISPSVTTASWVVTQYDCNRNGNRAEMLRVCTVRPLSLLLLEGVRAVFLPISLAQMFLAGCWLGSYFFSRGLRELEEELKNWISSDETWHCGGHAQPTSQCSVFFLEDCERERKNWMFSDMKLSSTYIKEFCVESCHKYVSSNCLTLN